MLFYINLERNIKGVYGINGIIIGGIICAVCIFCILRSVQKGKKQKNNRKDC